MSLIQFYQLKDGETGVNVLVERDTVWLSLQQIAELFSRDKSVISRHLKKIFHDQELERDSAVAFFATVQKEGERTVTRDVEHYNLDAILSVGYRVNSKRGIDFRRWASKVLQEHLIKGYSFNEERLASKGLKELEQAIALLSQTLATNVLVSDVGEAAIRIIHHYAKTWHLLLSYDDGTLHLPENATHGDVSLSYETLKTAIQQLKTTLMEQGEASALFGQEREGQFSAILGNIHQSFGGKDLYPTWQEKAAHLLYFLIKDHPFSDGNKRIASLVFLLYLEMQRTNKSNITDSGLVALALLVAESPPSNKDLMIRLIVNLMMK